MRKIVFLFARKDILIDTAAHRSIFPAFNDRNCARCKVCHIDPLVATVHGQVDRVLSFCTCRMEIGQAPRLPVPFESTDFAEVTVDGIEEIPGFVKALERRVHQIPHDLDELPVMTMYFVNGNSFSRGIAFLCRSRSNVSKHEHSPFQQ